MSASNEFSNASIPGFAQHDLEQVYLKRSEKKRKDDGNKLPIRRAQKWVENDRQPVATPLSDRAPEKSSTAHRSDDEIANELPKPIAKTTRPSSKEELLQTQEELARLAGLISESPEEHIGLLGSLAAMTLSADTTGRKMALATQLAVYTDIVPGYRIRPLAKAEIQGQLSKDVKKLRMFEQSLLNGYKGYVQQLEGLTVEDDTVDPSVRSVAIACACKLLTGMSHFNCRNEIIGIVSRKVSTRSTDDDFVKCRQALERLFEEDEEGHASLEAVTQITKMMKSKSYNIHESLLNTFLHLRLLSEFVHKASTNKVDRGESQQKSIRGRQKREFRTKRERKVLRERKEVEKEMKEADAAVSYEERDHNQAEMLKLVFVAYFRILKARTPHLMGAVLEGLARYAHLINQDFFGDVLEALKDLINTATSEDDEPTASAFRNPTRETLLCIITAFALLQGQTDVAKSANALHLDLHFFTTHLYRVVLPLSLDTSVERRALPTSESVLPVAPDARVNLATTSTLLLRALSAALSPPTGTRLVPPVRLAAFTKQLHTLSLHLPPRSAAAVLSLLQRIAAPHASRLAALWHTDERRGDGVFDPATPHLESSNPFACTVWETELLRLHFDPRVRAAARGVVSTVEGK